MTKRTLSLPTLACRPSPLALVGPGVQTCSLVPRSHETRRVRKDSYGDEWSSTRHPPPTTSYAGYNDNHHCTEQQQLVWSCMFPWTNRKTCADEKENRWTHKQFLTTFFNWAVSLPFQPQIGLCLNDRKRSEGITTGDALTDVVAAKSLPGIAF
ncbi:MAG: hypothetical protein J3Q66DRAFT_366579 [Benniella sp.]|nr:MAG: hypothetical protein J3Q66DRAFT_366579 [Benniella sp.]